MLGDGSHDVFIYDQFSVNILLQYVISIVLSDAISYMHEQSLISLISENQHDPYFYLK